MLEGAQPAEQPSLRDVVTEAYEEQEELVTETPEKSDRPRDEAGRFAPKEAEAKAEKVERPARAAKEAPEAPKPEVEPQAPAAPAYVAPKRPSSWKAELDPHWAKLPKEVHDEIARREADFARGVSTYKGEYDRLRPLGDALKPYEPMMQQAGITPDKFIHALASTHQTLTQGSKEQKLAAFARFAQEYQIPLNEMFVQGEDGKVYLNQQYTQPQQPAPQPGLTPEQARQIAQETWVQAERARQLNEFVSAKDSAGNPRYPHFETVKQTMDGLLRAGLAQDLPSAYQAALRHPNHSSIYDEMQKQQLATQEAEKMRQAAEAAKKAKANRISARPQTPTGTAGNGGAKTIREALEDSYQEVIDNR